MFRFIDKGQLNDLLILSGWGFDAYVFDLDKLPFNLILPTVPILDINKIDFDSPPFFSSKIIILGWSLGAHLAYDIVSKVPERIGGLIFVSLSKEFKKEILKEKIKELKKDKERALKKFYLYCFKGQEEDYKKFKRAHEKRCLSFWNQNELIAGLNYLSGHSVFFHNTKEIPILIIRGLKDLVANTTLDINAPNLKNIKLVEIDSGHLPFFKEKFYEEISLFQKGNKQFFF